MGLAERYRRRYCIRNVRYFHSHYRRVGAAPGRGADYISRERMDRSANARTERGASPRIRTAAAEMHRAREKAVRGGRGTGISPGAGSMYM